MSGHAELYFITSEARFRQARANLDRIVRSNRRNRRLLRRGREAKSIRPGPYIETCGTVWMALTIDMLRITSKSIAADSLS